MNEGRKQQVDVLFHQALSHPPEARAAFLAEACAGDEALRREVAALLAYDHPTDSFLEAPALALAARKLTDESAADQSSGSSDASTVRLPAAPSQLGPYKLERPIGKGGMGEVHLALDTRLQRKVAIKFLPAEFTNSKERVRRFAQEARTVSALNHPNILVIYDIGEVTAETTSTHYIVTEYVEGKTLRQKMTGAPQMELAEIIEVAIQVAAALAAAHEAGITHRDIKPENVMVRRDGLVKVLDFGLAKLAEPSISPINSEAATFIQNSTDTGVVLGTPRYMSPEQAHGEKVDGRTDIFSLGVMLYEMVAGRAPFVGATPSEILAAILRDEPPPLAENKPRELRRILSKALQKNRATRYQTATELLADLKQCRAQLSTEKNSIPTIDTSVVTSPMRTAGNHQRRRFVLVTLVSLILIVAATVYFSFFRGRETAIDSLAVLPFVNVGASPDTEYLSDGVTDSLINRLSQLPRLKVMSRNSVFRYKGKDTDAQVAGNALGVRAVLVGKVTQHGDDLSINVELVDVRDGSHLWGEQYTYKVSNLLPVQTDLARDVSQQLRLKLSRVEQQQLAKRGTNNPEAYELYLKGRYYKNSLDRKKQEKAIEYLQEAIAKDARFALPYAELVGVYVNGMTGVGATYPISSKEALQKAKEAAAKAVELDDTLAEVHLSLAHIARVFEWDWKTAEREYQRAIELTPNFTEAHHFYAHYLVLQGRFEEALAESLRALAFDPFDVGMNFHLGWFYYRTRQDEKAVEQLKKTLEMDPNYSGAHGVLGLIYGEQGRYPEAFAELQKNQELKGFDLRGYWGRIYALAGRRDQAQKLLAQLLAETQLPNKHVSPYHIAIIYASLGEKEQAFAWLDKAIDERDGQLSDPGLKVDRVFDSLRSDPRFADLLRRINLSP